jgi:hypothetical protein
MDANFRLKRLNVSNDERDPSLNHGIAYVVEKSAFLEHLAKFDKIPEEAKSTCNNHDAIKSSNMRGGEGHEASGLGSCECSRHDMKRPNGVGDLQKGERCVENFSFLFVQLLNNSL